MRGRQSAVLLIVSLVLGLVARLAQSRKAEYVRSHSCFHHLPRKTTQLTVRKKFILLYHKEFERVSYPCLDFTAACDTNIPFLV
jgi:hypothetical protein